MGGKRVQRKILTFFENKKGQIARQKSLTIWFFICINNINIKLLVI